MISHVDMRPIYNIFGPEVEATWIIISTSLRIFWTSSDWVRSAWIHLKSFSLKGTS